MLSKYVQPGDRVEMQRLRKSIASKENQKNYICKVNEILSEDTLEVTMPMEQTKLVLLPVDEEFEVCFQTQSGLYQCHATIIDRYKKENIYILLLELTTGLKKHQRREYYRYTCALEIDVRALEKEEIEAVEKKEKLYLSDMKWQKAVMLDLSGGGMRFVMPYQYDERQLIWCKCHLSLNGRFREYILVGIVLFTKEVDNRRGVYEHRIKFVNIDKKEQEELIRFIFEAERKERKRENGI